MPERSVTETRNSPLREKVSTVVCWTTKIIHQQFPDLSPTHINFLGAGLVGLGSWLATKERKFAAGILIALGSIADAFDGSLARLKDAEKPGSVNFKKGALYDVLSDRSQEWFLAWSRMVSAHKRGGFMGTMGELFALAAAITNPLPSVARALSEAKGKAVPESGKGITGLAGTRPGRGITGGGTAVEPGPHGLFQLAIDAFTSYSNVRTTIDRLQTAFSKSEGALSKETQDDAKTRLKVLLAFTAVSLAGSLFTYLRLHRKENKVPAEKTLSPFEYLGVISTIDQYLTEQDITHWFVGGTLTDFLGPQTEFSIDIAEKKITLVNPNQASSERKDGTTKDIDIVVNTADKRKLDEVRMVIDEWSKQARAKGIRFPQISMEAARYPDWPERSNLTQFVTAWEIDKQNTPHLVFGSVDQTLKPESIEPWTFDSGQGVTIPSFNPVAHALCYRLRVPSGEKKKDTTEAGTYDDWIIRLPYGKMSLVDGMARKVIAVGLQEGVDFNNMYKEWVDYIETLSKKPDLLTRLKGMLTGLYWGSSIGDKIAHGKGLFGFLSRFNDRMNG